jgi:ribonuclease HII
MILLDARYPEYGFAQHKGYGTRVHLQALEKFGAIKGQHRYSFAPVRKLYQ